MCVDTVYVHVFSGTTYMCTIGQELVVYYTVSRYAYRVTEPSLLGPMEGLPRNSSTLNYVSSIPSSTPRFCTQPYGPHAMPSSQNGSWSTTPFINCSTARAALKARGGTAHQQMMRLHEAGPGFPPRSASGKIIAMPLRVRLKPTCAVEAGHS